MHFVYSESFGESTRRIFLFLPEHPPNLRAEGFIDNLGPCGRNIFNRRKHIGKKSPANIRRACKKSMLRLVLESLSQHSRGDLLESRDVGAVDVVARGSKFRGGVEGILVYAAHDVVELFVHFFARPA